MKYHEGRIRNWDNLEEHHFVSLFTLSLPNFICLALTYSNIFSWNFTLVHSCHHLTFSNSESINNVFGLYVSCLPCITRTSIKNLRKPNQFYFSILFSFPAETDLTMVLNFDLRNWFSPLFCAACLGNQSFQRLFSGLSISSTFGRQTTLKIQRMLHTALLCWM